MKHLLLATLAACGFGHDYVKVDRVALGRVVVYRNGVAFYERRATVSGGELTVSVPRDRVDDFLKSLTVVDAITGKPLPVAIPRQQANGANLVMKLQLPSAQTADVVLTYVTESPAWKPSYRVVVGDKGKVMLEGWAIVDNTSGEDWKGVMVGVGSSSALSFKYDLWSVREVQRETLAAEDRFAVAPPTGVAPYAQHLPGNAVLGELDDKEIRKPTDKPDTTDLVRLFGRASNEADVVTAHESSKRSDDDAVEIPHNKRHRSFDTRSRPSDDDDDDQKGLEARLSRERDVAVGDAVLRDAVQATSGSNELIIIEGYADGAVPGAAERANARAQAVRDQLIDAGVAPDKIKIVAHTEAGSAERVRLLAQDGPPEQRKQPDDASAQPVGESNFASATPMTVGRGTSAMVSMVRQQTDGEVVYLYDPESERGNEHFAFRAVRFRNPTDSTLETGPVTVYGNERFIGEGLTEPIAPRSSAVVPYALDRQIVVERNDGEDDQLAKIVTVQRGIVTAEVQHVRHQKLTITNRLAEPARIYLRHTIAKGHALIEAPPAFEKIGDAHLFEVDLKAGECRVVDIAEATPVERTLDLNTSGALDMLKIYVSAPQGSPVLRAQLEKVLALHKSLVDLGELHTSLRARLDEYRARMTELHGQIVTLQAVKTGGELMKSLKDKLKDISDRVQKTTISLVDADEQVMLGRVRFQDALADLSLPDQSASISTQPSASAPAIRAR